MPEEYKPIYPKKHHAMQQVQHLVSRGGYAYWVAGVVPGRKLRAFVEKMRDRYAVDRTESQRRRARERGEANTQLVIYPLKREKRPQSDDFAFFLLVDREAPESLIWQLETPQNVFKRRITTPDGYELVKLPRKGSKPAWTWRMTNELYTAWEERLKGVIYKRDERGIRQAWWSFARMPGFHGVREQAKQLKRMAFYAWKRVRSDEPKPLRLPSFLGRRRALERVGVREYLRSLS